MEEFKITRTEIGLLQKNVTDLSRCKKNGTMYLLVGFPRSGKSTWAKENGNDSIIVSNDWVRENILHAPNKKSNDPAIWMITDSTIRIVLSQGKSVIVDGVNTTVAVRSYFISTANECNANVVIVWIKTSIEECIRRNNVSKKLPHDVLLKMYDRFEDPQPQEYDKMIVME